MRQIQAMWNLESTRQIGKVGCGSVRSGSRPGIVICIPFLCMIYAFALEGLSLDEWVRFQIRNRIKAY